MNHSSAHGYTDNEKPLKQEQPSEEKQKVWLVITKQLLIVGCFSTEEKARKYTGAGVDVLVQGLEVL